MGFIGLGGWDWKDGADESDGFALLRSETGLGRSTRGARTQGMSPLKRLNMTKPQPGRSPRFALLRSKTVSDTVALGHLHSCLGYLRERAGLIFGYCTDQKLSMSWVIWTVLLLGAKMSIRIGTRPLATRIVAVMS